MAQARNTHEVFTERIHTTLYTKDGHTICSKWQKDNGCPNKHDAKHFCSGCGATTHRAHPRTPYKVIAWECALLDANLLDRFHKLLNGFRHGFNLDFPLISHVQSPPNEDSVILSFGATPSAGVYGHITNRAAEIMRWRCIGPLDKWVDDHTFFCILLTHKDSHNVMRQEWHQELTKSGLCHTGSCIWYGGQELYDGSVKEFNEDCSYPIVDLSVSSVRTKHDKQFIYNLTDINKISADLRIPWETSKDQPFQT
jgi:hypothetical protein